MAVGAGAGMIRFAVFDENGPAESWPLIHAHLLERDDAVIRGDISFKRGIITCKRRSSQATALCLQHHAGAMGRLMLQTCLLPDREQPYVLSLELARHRIKTFIAKSEEWQMFELSAEHPATKLWEHARELFSQAIVEPDPFKADRLATASLADAVDATERLALAHAEILLHRRYGNRAASGTTLGIGIWPWGGVPSAREIIAKEFDVLNIALSWKDLEASEGRFSWGPLDEWLTWAQQNGKPVVMGPLLDFSKDRLPAWMEVWRHDYDTCRDLAFDFMQRVVGRYRNVVGLWNVASGLAANANFEFSPSQMIELTRMANLLVKQSRKSARTMIELVQPFGEYGALRRDSVPPLQYLDRLIQEGVRVDAVGLRLAGQVDNGLQPARDLMQISNLLDRFFLIEIPVMITGFGVPSSPQPDTAGTWHDAWSLDNQSAWAGRLVPIALSKPFVESVFWGDLVDYPCATVPTGGVLTSNGQAKPVLARLTGIRRRLRKPLGALRYETRAGVLGGAGITDEP